MHMRQVRKNVVQSAATSVACALQPFWTIISRCTLGHTLFDPYCGKRLMLQVETVPNGPDQKMTSHAVESAHIFFICTNV